MPVRMPLRGVIAAITAIVASTLVPVPAAAWAVVDPEEPTTSPRSCVEDVTVQGTAAADVLVGWLRKPDSFRGGDGNDEVFGGETGNCYDLGGGDDLAKNWIEPAAAGFASPESPYPTANHSFEWMSASEYDQVDAGSGNDRVDLFAAIVALGPGDDRANVYSGVVAGGPGAEEIKLVSGSVHTGLDDGDDVVEVAFGDAVTGPGDDRVSVSHGDVYTGTGNDTAGVSHGWLWTGDGDDTIFSHYATVDAGDGDDFVRMYTGNVDAGAGADTIVVTPLDAEMTAPPEAGIDAGPDADVVWIVNGAVAGEDGNDEIHLERGTVCGDEGDDEVSQASGRSRLGEGDDIATLQIGYTYEFDQQGLETGFGEPVSYEGVPYPECGTTSTTLQWDVEGQAGNDAIKATFASASGGAGNDVVQSATRLHGGTGTDVLVHSVPAGLDATQLEDSRPFVVRAQDGEVDEIYCGAYVLDVLLVDAIDVVDPACTGDPGDLVDPVVSAPDSVAPIGDTCTEIAASVGWSVGDLCSYDPSPTIGDLRTADWTLTTETYPYGELVPVEPAHDPDPIEPGNPAPPATDPTVTDPAPSDPTDPRDPTSLTSTRPDAAWTQRRTARLTRGRLHIGSIACRGPQGSTCRVVVRISVRTSWKRPPVRVSRLMSVPAGRRAPASLAIPVRLRAHVAKSTKRVRVEVQTQRGTSGRWYGYSVGVARR